MSNNFDPDHSVGPDLFPNCFQWLSAHDMIKVTSSKERVTVNSEIFARVLFSHMRSFVKNKSLQNGEITPLFTDIGKSCLIHDILTSQICLLMLFWKIKCSLKFLNLQLIAYHEISEPVVCTNYGKAR